MKYNHGLFGKLKFIKDNICFYLVFLDVSHYLLECSDFRYD